jgi:electron transport complex protein RnfB
MNLIQRIDALLPQTQCGKCGHAGCMPYAQGIASGEPINRCPPGGSETIAALANLLHLPLIALDTARGRAPAQVAHIREAECIGCTKCIQACPVDAILGATKLMHSVLVNECTGCELCVAPCPVDCIDLRPLPDTAGVALIGDMATTDEQLLARSLKRDRARRRYEQRNARLQAVAARRQSERLARQSPSTSSPTQAAVALSPIERIRGQKAAAADGGLKQAKIAVAMGRAQLNKTLKAFVTPPTREQCMKLAQLQQELDRAERHLATQQATPSCEGIV